MLEIVGLLASETSVSAAARILLERLLAITGTQRGFLVMREAGDVVDVFNVGFDRAAVSPEERRFSRRLVRMATDSREPIYSASASSDPRLAAFESIAGLGPRTVFVVPLREREAVHGVVYFDGPAPIDEHVQDWVIELARLTAPLLRRAIEEETMRRRLQTLESDLLAQFDFAGIVTRDPRMLQVLRTVVQVADATAPVLIRGETGTGKELVARALHINSSRRARPFVALHCSALPEDLLESELFGHVRGAFTGAASDRAGRIASARGGTLFLDEIGELSLDVQVKLLRFLQSGEIQRVGSDHIEHVDVRIVCATHRDLAELLKDGRFRQDLYYRIHVVEVVLPPLRERSGDCELLIEHFLARYGKQRGIAFRLTAQARAALLAHGYPGNARELEHAIERMVLLATTRELGIELLPPDIRPDPPEVRSIRDYTAAELKAARTAAVAAVEAQFVAGLLQKSDGNVSAAARLAGMPRSHLQKLIARRRPR